MGVYNDASDVSNPREGLRLTDIPAHDPYVWVDKANGVYYLYTSGSPRLNGMERYGVVTYRSMDLLNWEGPIVVFTVPDDVWAHPMHGTWAPEVHQYKGKIYLFGTLNNRTRQLEVR